MLKKGQFPTEAYGDGIIIRRIEILDKVKKKAKANKIVIMKGLAPKNIMDLEKQQRDNATTYEDAADKLLAKWDEHPNQGIVMSVGSGRDIGGGTLLIPKVKVGTHILYRGNSGEPMIINKQLYWIIHDHDIFSTVPAAELIK